MLACFCLTIAFSKIYLLNIVIFLCMRLRTSGCTWDLKGTRHNGLFDALPPLAGPMNNANALLTSLKYAFTSFYYGTLMFVVCFPSNAHIFTAKHRVFPALHQPQEPDLGHLQLMVVHQRWVYYDQKSPDSDERRRSEILSIFRDQETN